MGSYQHAGRVRFLRRKAPRRTWNSPPEIRCLKHPPKQGEPNRQKINSIKCLRKFLCNFRSVYADGPKYLTDAARAWSKTFPDEFWQKLVRVKGYDSYYALRRPAFVGHWVNDIVYARLAPGIKTKLKEINPRTEGGSRKNKHHQHLTDDGLPELKDHLKKVMVLMDAASSKKEFEKLLNRSLPRFEDTLKLPLDDH